MQDSNLFLENSPRLFINLSNHPISGWSEAQLSEARKFGQLLDIVFPAVKADWDKKDITHVAEEIVDHIRRIAPTPEKAAIHVMGEMTLTFCLVETLKSMGYRCLASTTERESWFDEKGNKVSVFRFVRFRDY